ncbi:Aste57867_4092 [Aphanomyces stellatus]|uniref:Aste57867_4092 protein n=1 Tax=Aphanomyces stellatus TaxID=120398 RepID=A0A485KFC9_9STRA|nr:hypothetical protein As57867_004081 [Aphanomyces stellatus]VFT81225.1 Aste57867_4092 [Aphanomyces stellatus]
MDAGYTPPTPIPSTYSTVVFVGGGIGVTPLMGQIMHLLHARPQQEVYLIWHVKTVDMVSQFQPWLHELVSLAESNHGRLHLNLHVTQNDATGIAIDDLLSSPLSSFSSSSFPLTPSTATPRPYAHLSTLRKLLVLTFAFLCSGTLLVFVRYGQKFIKSDKSYWPLQRFMEFVVVIIGSYFAYGVAAFGANQVSPLGDEVPPVARLAATQYMARDEFVSYFDVQFQRANWVELFQTIETDARVQSTACARSVGIYVSGPTALSSAVAKATAGNAMYDMHVEEFEM